MLFMNKPYQTLIFLLAVAVLYLSISAIVPDDAFMVLGVKLRVPNPLGELIKNKPEPLANTIDSVMPAAYSEEQTFTDSTTVRTGSSVQGLELVKNGGKVDSAYVKTARSVDVTYSIEIPGNGKPFFGFFNAIKSKSENELIRVLHYGDSQIEGDRITKEVRTVLQNEFGGQGFGLIPVWNAEYLPPGFRVHLTEQVKVSSLVKAIPSQKAQCVLGSITEVVPAESFREVITFTVTSKVNFKNLQVISGGADSSYAFKIIVDGIESDDKRVEHGTGVNLISFSLPNQFRKISILVKNPSPLKIYGFLAESGSGLSVSNIALRGSSGNFFNQFDPQVASEIFRLLNVRLVILQFGINVVPSNLSSYAYYERLMDQQVRSIRRFAPQADVLVVGVSDMATRIDGELCSYPSVELVLRAQRRAAYQSGAAFWDGYHVMGGRGSIIDWVNATPPLATKDYAHFTGYGAKRFGQKLALAITSAINSLGKTSVDSNPVQIDSVSHE